MAKYVFPCLPWSKYNNNVGQFLDPEYYKTIGSEHPGADINANTGGNSDLGHNVYAITKGRVEVAQWFPVWGNIVLIFHPGPGVWSQSAHLNEIFVEVGQEVEAGEVIGTIGRGANNRYIAHLHFEIRYQPVPANYWSSTVFKNRLAARNDIKSKYVDPIVFLRKVNASTT